MKKLEFPHFCPGCYSHNILQTPMSPPDMSGIGGGIVLGIHDQQVQAPQKRHQPRILQHRADPSGQPSGHLMVRKVAEGGGSVGNPITKATVRMIDPDRLNMKTTEPEWALILVPECESAGQLPKLDGEEGRFHLTPERGTQ